MPHLTKLTYLCLIIGTEQSTYLFEMKRWYAVYTHSRAEKQVLERLTLEGIEAYLPLQKKLKYWSDRKKWVEEPLFRSYIFVNINPDKDYFKVLNSYGVVCFIRFENKLAAIPENQIAAIKSLLNSGLTYEITNEVYEPGDHMQIVYGDMKGYSGHLIDYRGKYNVLLEIENIRQNIVLNIPAEHLKKIQPAGATTSLEEKIARTGTM